MHRSSGITVSQSASNSKSSVDWPPSFRTTSEWLKDKNVDRWKSFFETNGYLVIDGILDEQELKMYREIYDAMLNNEIDTSEHRHDLGNHADAQQKNVENICQIMWPSVYVDKLSMGPLHNRAEAVARICLGDDISFDFDMMIYKAPNTNTETPWHQDESYWLDMPDKRSLSVWTAMDDATVDNGCMWFVPKSHSEAELRPNRRVTPEVHVRMTDHVDPGEGLACPIRAGSCTLHHGRTLHHTKGNSTDSRRRAYILNFRPQTMIDYERQHNYDHGKGGVHDIIKPDQ